MRTPLGLTKHRNALLNTPTSIFSKRSLTLAEVAGKPTVLNENEISIGMSVLRLKTTTATDSSAKGLHHTS